MSEGKQFLVLLFAHLLADYPLQGDFLAKMKGQYALLMLTHCAIWTGCICIAGHLVGLSAHPLMIGILFCCHTAADEFKAHGGYGKNDPLGWPLWCDQGIHVLQLCAFLWIR